MEHEPWLRMWTQPCPGCLGTGGRWHPYKRILWPCPYCPVPQHSSTKETNDAN